MEGVDTHDIGDSMRALYNEHDESLQQAGPESPEGRTGRRVRHIVAVLVLYIYAEPSGTHS